MTMRLGPATMYKQQMMAAKARPVVLMSLPRTQTGLVEAWPFRYFIMLNPVAVGKCVDYLLMNVRGGHCHRVSLPVNEGVSIIIHRKMKSDRDEARLLETIFQS